MSRQSWSRRPFNPSNKPGTCLWCGRALKPSGCLVVIPDTMPVEYRPDVGLGVGGDGFFCSLVDGYTWAVTVAELGHRIHRKVEP